MLSSHICDGIQAALAALLDGDFAPAAHSLLAALGYRSERTLELSGSVDDFIEQFPASNKNTKTEQAFRDNVQSARILFQVTDAEIAAHSTLFDTGDFARGKKRSFLFAAVELNGASYPRGQYATFTRELNKRFPMPTVVLFKTAADVLTLSFVYRRPHKRDSNRDVLGHVSLIREINPARSHRAHLDILHALSLENRLQWMMDHEKPRNFDGLLAAWLNALDTEELNRRFYQDLYKWFERAVNEARFPTGEARTLHPEEHVIRLITRLLFVWFIKEKKLIADALFIEEQIKPLLMDYDQDDGDSYYRTVLQNLFFATLNTEIAKRGFSQVKNATHRNFSRYRYKKEMRDPAALLCLFRQTPFINGGLFDCLDSEAATRYGGWRIDCFSDVHCHKLSIPNRLFFDDASADSGRAAGLITLFDRYKFTVEENTPAEQEVALDPELLGKVFENLLAAYNPETRETVRKQTGSYYTPRPVVDYMVDEALVAALAQKCQPTDGDHDSWQERLRYLLNYEAAFDDANELFEADKAEGLVRAIAEVKVLDPAVGSGAFPMGVLHKLTLALRRIDPDNSRWEQLQKERARAKADAAFDTQDQWERDSELKEISETFEHYRDSDFGRKLYLIQNSLFGVDIQPVAGQIAKLRFFISLAIEQEVDATAENFGIKPLPNLETRFVAANTLIALKAAEQPDLFRQRIEALKTKLAENRERHFHATTRPQKLKCKDEDKRLREALARELNAAGLPQDDANKIAQWDPYDQNAKADWFDPEYMFGVTDGFDVVIGNPPYIQLQKNRGELGQLYKEAGYNTFVRTGDIYQLFYEKGCQLLTPQRGLLSYITSNSWLKAQYGKLTRRYFAEQHTPLRLLEMGKDVFENAIVDTNILIARSGKSDAICKAVDMDRLPDKAFPPEENLWGQLRPREERPWSALSAIEQSIMDKMEAAGTPLKDWDVKINFGLKTGYDKAFVIDDETKQSLVAADLSSANIIKPLLRGRDIRRYQAQWAGLWLIDTHNGYGNVPAISIDDYPAVKVHLDGFYPQLAKRQDKGKTPYNLRNCAYHQDFDKEKLVWMQMTPQGRFAYSNDRVYANAKTFILTGEHLKYLCAALNSKLVTWFVSNTAVTTGMGLIQWQKFVVETIPIPKITADKDDLSATIVDYIIYLKKQPSTDGKNLAHAQEYLMVKYFERIVDGLVYELYLTDELHRADKYFFKPLRDEHLPSIEEIPGDKMSVLRAIFERLFDKKHPVRKNLFFLDSLEIIRTIEGKA